MWCIQNIELVFNHWIIKDVDLLGNKYSLNLGRFPEVRTAGRTIAGPVILTMKNALSSIFRITRSETEL